MLTSVIALEIELKRKYLGEEAVNLAECPYASYTAKDWALQYLAWYGQIDGNHHKLWVLDQVARILNGTPVIVTKASWSDGFFEYRYNLDQPSEAYLQWRQDIAWRQYIAMRFDDEEVDWYDLSKVSDYTPTEWALGYIEDWGNADDPEHNLWVMDQVALILHGTPIITKPFECEGDPDIFIDTGKPSKAYIDWRRKRLPDIDSDGDETEGRGYDRGKFNVSYTDYYYKYNEGCPP